MALYRDRISVTGAARDLAEVGGGIVVNGFIGREIENRALTTPVEPASSTSQKILAGAANNIPKLVLYYLFNKVNLHGAAAASIGMVGYDVLIRLTNEGVNPASASITFDNKHYRILQQPQQLQQNQLQLQPQIHSKATSFNAPEIQERQRKYGAMPNFDKPANWEQPRYGSLPFEDSNVPVERQKKYGFAATVESKNIGTLYGMQ